MSIDVGKCATNISLVVHDITDLSEEFIDNVKIYGRMPILDLEPIQPRTEEGLVAYYKFNGDAKDFSGWGNDGTVYGVTLTEDRHGNTNSAYFFDGTSHIEVPNSSSLSAVGKSVTCSVWGKPDGWYHTGEEWMAILCNPDYNDIDDDWRFKRFYRRGYQADACHYFFQGDI